MSNVRDVLKDSLASFVDLLVDEELALIREDVESSKKFYQEKLDDILSELKTETADIRKDTNSEIDKIHTLNSDLISSIDTKLKTVESNLESKFADFQLSFEEEVRSKITENPTVSELKERLNEKDLVIEELQEKLVKLESKFKDFEDFVENSKKEAEEQKLQKEKEASFKEFEEMTNTLDEVPLPADNIGMQEFSPSENNPHPEVTIDATGQYIYKPL
jgi:uncharacterized coiled-coil protein SlyX